jgi:hypothetical protein
VSGAKNLMSIALVGPAYGAICPDHSTKAYHVTPDARCKPLFHRLEKK